MVKEKQLLIDLFQRCGAKELAFLVNSGFGFGCMLGVFQMLLWIFFEVPWTLAAGGAVVGYLTNLIALKLIFEPVEPMKLGPFVLQGMFLKRQVEVSEEFAECLTEKLFTSESLWHHMLTGPKSEAFAKLLHARTQKLMGGAAAVRRTAAKGSLGQGGGRGGGGRGPLLPSPPPPPPVTQLLPHPRPARPITPGALRRRPTYGVRWRRLVVEPRVARERSRPRTAAAGTSHAHAHAHLVLRNALCNALHRACAPHVCRMCTAPRAGAAGAAAAARLCR